MVGKQLLELRNERGHDDLHAGVKQRSQGGQRNSERHGDLDILAEQHSESATEDRAHGDIGRHDTAEAHVADKDKLELGCKDNALGRMAEQGTQNSHAENRACELGRSPPIKELCPHQRKADDKGGSNVHYVLPSDSYVLQSPTARPLPQTRLPR